MPESATLATRGELEEIARAMRGAVGSLRAAAETLEELPTLAEAPRRRLLAVVAEEAERLGELVRRLERTAQVAATGGGAEATGTTTVGELLTRLSAAAGELGFEVASQFREEAVPPETVLAVAAAPAVAAAGGFLAELRRELATTRLSLGVRIVDRHLLLDLGWTPEAADLPRLLDWQGAALDAPPASSAADEAERRGLRPLARDHDGEAWFNLDRDGSAAHVKVLLPLAAVARTSTL